MDARGSGRRSERGIDACVHPWELGPACRGRPPRHPAVPAPRERGRPLWREEAPPGAGGGKRAGPNVRVAQGWPPRVDAPLRWGHRRPRGRAGGLGLRGRRAPPHGPRLGRPLRLHRHGGAPRHASGSTPAWRRQHAADPGLAPGADAAADPGALAPPARLQGHRRPRPAAKEDPVRRRLPGARAPYHCQEERRRRRPPRAPGAL